MERLTQYINGYAHGAEGVNKDNLTGKFCRGCFEATAVVEKLAEYENAEENGFLSNLQSKYKEVNSELKEAFEECNELFDIAWDLNINENSRTTFSQKVTSYMPGIMQTISAIICSHK